MDARDWIAERMLQWGAPAIIPSIEEAPDSVWVEDPPNGFAPGYYVKRRVPLEHRLVGDGRVVRLDFWRGGTKYQIRCGRKFDESENIEAIQAVLEVLIGWVEDGVVESWPRAFSPFAIREQDRADEWWRVLRLPPDATLVEIEAGYKRACLSAHPDRGGDHEAFLRVQKAYERAMAAQ